MVPTESDKCRLSISPTTWLDSLFDIIHNKVVYKLDDLLGLRQYLYSILSNRAITTVIALLESIINLGNLIFADPLSHVTW